MDQLYPCGLLYSHSVRYHCVKRSCNSNSERNCPRRSILKVMASSGHVTTSAWGPLNSPLALSY